MAMDCETCGKTFKNSHRPGSICLKCEKHKAVERKAFATTDAKWAALDEVEVCHCIFRKMDNTHSPKVFWTMQ